MQVTLKAFILLAASLPLLALANTEQPARDALALREACSEFSQAEMRDCLLKQAKESELALEKARKTVASRIAEWDEERRDIEKASAAFGASQQRFMQYRDSQCQFEASLSGGAAGNAREIRQQSCVAALNFERAEALNNSISGLPVK